MGNSTSSVALTTPPSNSFPRHHQRYHHAVPSPVVPPAPVTKVLPVPALPEQRALLRSTQNGAILHQGGTISGRRYSIGSLHTSKEQMPSLDEDMGSPIHRRRNTMGSASSKAREVRNQKGYLQMSDGSSDVKKRHQRKHQHQQHFYGSEPDLRSPVPSSQHHQNRPPRMRKKYKAPAPPPQGCHDAKGDSRDSPQRTRLFRTRAETTQMMNSSSRAALMHESGSNPLPVSCERVRRGKEAAVVRRGDVGELGAATDARSNSPAAVVRRRKASPAAEAGRSRRDGEKTGSSGGGKMEGFAQGGKWLSSPEFQAELLRVTMDRGIRKAKRNPINSSGRSRDGSGSRETPRVGANKEQKMLETKSHGKLDQESRMPKSQPERPKETAPSPAPTPFYFGMEGDIEDERKTKALSEERDKVEKFAEQVRQRRMEEVLTEEVEWRRRSDDEEAEESGIDLCLRPTLPKKQPQVPRFSPVAAWRLLGNPAVMHSPEASIVLTDNLLPVKVPVVDSSRVIEMEPRGEKSADSGISGDASPSPGAPILRGAPPSPTVWTPQQDLAEEESSSEDGPVNVPHPPHVLYLSLSLPRAADCSMWTSPYTRGRESSLDKLKRSFSGAIFGKSDEWNSMGERALDDNWSLGHCGVKREGAQLPAGDVSDSGCMGRVMYLPQGPLSPTQRCHSLDLLGGEILSGGHDFPVRAKEGWEDDAMRRVEEDFERGRALDRARLRMQLRALNESEREADRSVGYGPSSLPADVRYEPDGDDTPASFERRPHSDDPLSSSPPPSSSSSPLPSSSPSPSPARRRRGTPSSSSAAQKITRREWRREHKKGPPPTRVLSEFRQQRRDYREPPKGSANVRPPAQQHIRHPSVVCDIPKSGDTKQESSPVSGSSDSASKSVTKLTERVVTGAPSGQSSAKASSTKTPSDNYRRDFAHGSLPGPIDINPTDKRPVHRNTRSLTPVGRHEGEPLDRNAKSNASSISSLCSLDAAKRGKSSSGGNSLDVVSRDASSDSKRNMENNGASTDGLRSKGPFFTSLQPYTPGKGYRPISFNPGNQTQKLAQSVS